MKCHWELLIIRALGRFPFNQNFQKSGNSGKWYRNFPEKFPEIPETVEFSEMRIIQPKIPEIPGLKLNGEKLPGS